MAKSEGARGPPRGSQPRTPSCERRCHDGRCEARKLQCLAAGERVASASRLVVRTGSVPPVCRACKLGHAEVVRALASSGLDRTDPDEREACLFHECYDGHVQCAQVASACQLTCCYRRYRRCSHTRLGCWLCCCVDHAGVADADADATPTTAAADAGAAGIASQRFEPSSIAHRRRTAAVLPADITARAQGPQPPAPHLLCSPVSVTVGREAIGLYEGGGQGEGPRDREAGAASARMGWSSGCEGLTPRAG